MRYAVLISAALFLLTPAAAQAAPKVSVTLSQNSVRYGAAHKLDGTLVDGATPLAGQEVVLEGRRYPYEGSYRVIARTTTDPTGKFEFKPVLDRNHKLRVTVPALATTSSIVQSYTLPSFDLSFRALRPGVVRLYQRYTVPKTVKLTSPTLFYLGKRGAKKAAMRKTGDVVRTKAGHYTSHVDVTLPDSWHGAFRYASCFRPSPSTGMGDPGAKCPKLKLTF